MARPSVQLVTDRGELDLYNETSIDLTLSIKDVREPLEFLYDYSKTITLPATNNNKKVLGLFDIPGQASFDVNPKFNISADIIINGSTYKSGYIRMDEMVTEDDVVTEIEVEFVHTLIGIKEKLEGTELWKIDLSEYEHAKTKDNIEKSWDTSIIVNGKETDFEVGRGYVYPLLDLGGREGKNIWTEEDFRPAMYIRDLLDRILWDVGGYRIKSDFLDSEDFKRLVIPTVTKEELSETEKDKRRAAGTVGDHLTLPNDFPSDLNIGDVSFLIADDFITNQSTVSTQWERKDIERLNDNNDGPEQSNDDKSFDPYSILTDTAGEYIAPANGRYNIKAGIAAQCYMYIPWGEALDNSNFAITDFVRNDNTTVFSYWGANFPNVKLRVYKQDQNGNQTLLTTKTRHLQPNMPWGENNNTQQYEDDVINNYLPYNWLWMRDAVSQDQQQYFTSPGSLINTTTIEIDEDFFLNENDVIFISVSHNLNDNTLGYQYRLDYDDVGGESARVLFDMQGNVLSNLNSQGGGTFDFESYGNFQMFVGLQSGWDNNYLKVSAADEQGAVGAGGIVNIARGLPDLTYSEFLKDIFHLFNLYTMEEEPGVLRIEPFQYFFDIGTVRDWSDRIDRGSDQVKEFNPEIAGRYKFTYAEGNDYLNERYNDEYGEIYGEKKLKFTNDRTDDEVELELKFAPSVLDRIEGKPITRILGSKDTDEPTNHKTIDSRKGHILYYNFLGIELANDWGFKHGSQTNKTTVYRSVLPYAGHLDNPFDPSWDINFGMVREYPTKKITPNTVYNLYHSEWVRNIVDERSHLLTVQIAMDHKELMELSLNDTIYIDGDTYIINKVEDMDVTDLTKPVEFELLHMPFFDTEQRNFKQIEIDNDGTDITNGDVDVGPGYGDVTVGIIQNGSIVNGTFQSGDIEFRTKRIGENSEHINSSGNVNIKASNNTIKGERNILTEGVVNTTVQGNDNNIVGPGDNMIVKGESNLVEEEAESVTIEGDNNTVNNNVENVLVRGSNNVVEEGVKNTTLLGDGITADTSNLTYYGQRYVQKDDTTIYYNFNRLVAVKNDVDNPFKENDFDTMDAALNKVARLGANNNIKTVDGGNDTV